MFSILKYTCAHDGFGSEKLGRFVKTAVHIFKENFIRAFLKRISLFIDCPQVSSKYVQKKNKCYAKGLQNCKLCVQKTFTKKHVVKTVTNLKWLSCFQQKLSDLDQSFLSMAVIRAFYLFQWPFWERKLISTD